MKISVVGLGFVGTVTGACLCEMGHEVVGVDLDQGKVDLFANGRAPILEPQIDQLMADVWRSGRLSGASDLAAAVAATDVTFVCVGTLRNTDGSQDISAVENVIQSIGEAIVKKKAFHSLDCASGHDARPHHETAGAHDGRLRRRALWVSQQSGIHT